MNFLKKIFGSGKPAPAAISRTEHEERIRQKTDQLWDFIEEVLISFNQQSCQCAFPRFRQIVAIDCVDYRKNFYCSETEGFIDRARKYYTAVKLESGPEAYNEEWTCNKCGSIFTYGWADFSIHVNRAFLKQKDLRIGDIGALPEVPIPLYVGIFGHALPGYDQLTPVDFETFSKYITARQD